MLTPRNHTLLFTVLLIAFLQMTAFSQRKDVLLTNSQSIEVEAYKDIDGSPYFFSKWQLGKVYGKQDNKENEEVYLLNYNGYTKSFEVRKDNNFITLDEKYYNKIVIETKEAGEKKTSIFQTNLHPIYSNRFMKMVFQGTGFYVIEDYQVRLGKREQKAYATNQSSQFFTVSPNYYLVKNKKAKPIKLKKKHLLSLFKEEAAALKSFVKSNRLKMNNEEDLVLFLGYYEQLSNPKSTIAANKSLNE